MRVPGVVEDRHSQRNRQLNNREHDRVGTTVFVVKLDADEALVDPAADLAQGLMLIAGVDVAIAQHTARESLHRLAHPSVAFAEALSRGRPSGCQDRAAELVDAQLVGCLDELPIGLGPVRTAVMVQVRVGIDDLAQRQARPPTCSCQAGPPLRRRNPRQPRLSEPAETRDARVLSEPSS